MAENKFIKDIRLIRTGDLLLFSNMSHTSMGIRLTTSSMWNHVGVAVWFGTQETMKLFPGYINDQKEEEIGRIREEPMRLYCFESNNNAVYDRVSSTFTSGVRLVPIDTLLDRYDYIAWRPVCFHRDVVFYQRLWAFIEDYCGQKYHKDPIRMVLSALNVHLDKFEPEGNDVFCSQLVARLFQHFKLLPAEPPAYTYLPRHFASDSNYISEECFEAPEIIFYTKPFLSVYILGFLVVLFVIIWIGLLWINRKTKFVAV
jgi:hypothetical protein